MGCEPEPESIDSVLHGGKLRNHGDGQVKRHILNGYSGAPPKEPVQEYRAAFPRLTIRKIAGLRDRTHNPSTFPTSAGRRRRSRVEFDVVKQETHDSHLLVPIEICELLFDTVSLSRESDTL